MSYKNLSGHLYIDRMMKYLVCVGKASTLDEESLSKNGEDGESSDLL